MSSELATRNQGDEYRLGRGDLLRITVFGHEDLSGEYEIDSAGQITLPLVGDLLVVNHSLAEVEQLFVSALKSDYLKNPVISVEVIHYRDCFIIAEVVSRAELSLGVIPDRGWDGDWDGDWDMLFDQIPEGDWDIFLAPVPYGDRDSLGTVPKTRSRRPSEVSDCHCEPGMRVFDLAGKCGMDPNDGVLVHRDGKVERAGPETVVMPGDVIVQERFF